MIRFIVHGHDDDKYHHDDGGGLGKNIHKNKTTYWMNEYINE